MDAGCRDKTGRLLVHVTTRL